jgi:hypothetical protein
MYALFAWRINASSLHAQEIRDDVRATLGDQRTRRLLLDNVFAIEMADAADFDGLAVGLEDIHKKFGEDFTYVCTRCEPPNVVFRPSRADRPAWDQAIWSILQ